MQAFKAIEKIKKGEKVNSLKNEFRQMQKKRDSVKRTQRAYKGAKLSAAW